MIGPLAEHADGFRAELLSHGYRRDGVARQFQLMADVSGWLSASGAEPSELASAALVDELFQARRAEGCKSLLSRWALTPLIAYLASLDEVPATLVVTGSPNEVLIEKYLPYPANVSGQQQQDRRYS